MKWFLIICVFMFFAGWCLNKETEAARHKHHWGKAKTGHVVGNNAVTKSNQDDEFETEIELWIVKYTEPDQEEVFYDMYFGVEGGALEDAKKVQIEVPNGKKLELKKKLAVSSFEAELWGMSYEDLQDEIPDGKYVITFSPKKLESKLSIDITHDFPSIPEISYPVNGATDVPLGFTIEWESLSDSDIDGWLVNIEGEGDFEEGGDELDFEKYLPKSTTTFSIPGGLLQPNSQYYISLGVFKEGKNGAIASVRSISFTTGSE